MKNKPAYAIDSVDHALRLAAILQQEGPLRVTDVAERLGVSASTAHRLLAMLVYRDFAEQGPDRRYRAGRVLRVAQIFGAPVALLRRLALPHLRQLVDRVQETANLMVLAGVEVRFIATMECDQILRVGDREGRALPAHLSSGGKAILAALPPAALSALLGDLDNVDGERLQRELAAVRKRGFAINNQATEAGVTAIGVAIRHPDHGSDASVSLAIPSARFRRNLLPTWAAALSQTVAEIERDLAAKAPAGP